MKLSDLPNNSSGIVTKVRGRGAFRKRITEMGFVKGKEVTVVKQAPLKDPVEYSIMGYEVSLRRSEASLIEVVSKEEAQSFVKQEFGGTFGYESFKKAATEKGKTINVALVGNPNAGKTTLFNHAAGAHEHVGNYSGVTVDLKKATFKQKGYTINLIDLPGTYSLTAYSPEELFVRNYILNEAPDIVLNVLDSSNLERNLYLTTQLIDMDIKVIGALNMYDELEQQGARFDYKKLTRMTGVPLVPTISSKGKGIDELFDVIIRAYEDVLPELRQVHINYGAECERAIKQLHQLFMADGNQFVTTRVSPRFLALKMLEKDAEAEKLASKCANYAQIKQASDKCIKELEATNDEDSETQVTDAKYGFITGALKQTLQSGPISRSKRTELIDMFLTHKLFGFPIFIFFMWFMFQTTFKVGAYPMDWIDGIVGFISSTLQNNMPAGTLKDLLIDGIIGGVGGVIIFLPNIVILFFFISLMEDTGYMARVAFIMDKIMQKVGLHGKSFIPLLMGFGCNVPAIMSTRTLENRNDRLLTMLINPLMSCSARLPVYLLIVGAVFPQKAGTVLFGIYIFGILIAGLMAIIFKKALFKAKEAPFVMELPPYRIPTAKSTVRHMWHKASEYLKKMGGIILVASILIWALGYFPKESESLQPLDNAIAELQLQTQSEAIQNQIAELENQRVTLQQKNSYIGQLGVLVSPVLKPMGFDWKMSIAIITGITAKEVVVSTMGVLYQANGDASLERKLKETVYDSGQQIGKPVFSPVVAMSFMVFVLIYFPCIAVVAAIKRESNSWKWALFTIFYTTGLAWVLSYLTFKVGTLLF